MAQPSILLSPVTAGIVTLSFNRPSVGNALDFDAFVEWHQALAALAKDPAVKAVIVTGTGRLFSAGADVSRMLKSQAKAGGMRNLLWKGSSQVTRELIDFPKFLVAAVNGPVSGYPAAALGLFDAVYVSDQAHYALPFVHLGIAPEACSSYTLIRKVGASNAFDILYSGRRVSAAEMVTLGLALQVLPQDGFLSAVKQRVATQMDLCEPTSLLLTKRLLRPAAERERLHEINKAETEVVLGQFETGVAQKRFADVYLRLQSKKKSGASKL